MYVSKKSHHISRFFSYHQLEGKDHVTNNKTNQTATKKKKKKTEKKYSF